MINVCQRVCTDVYELTRIMLFVSRRNIQNSFRNYFLNLNRVVFKLCIWIQSGLLHFTIY